MAGAWRGWGYFLVCFIKHEIPICNVVKHNRREIEVLRGLFKRVALGIVMGVTVLGALGVHAGVKIQKGKIVYKDPYVSIVITGGWEEAKESANTIYFKGPTSDSVYVNCTCVANGWEIAYEDVDNRVDGGYVNVMARCKFNSEESHEVRLNFYVGGTGSLDLDCDADWDGGISESDEPIEESIGGLVGLDKLAPLELKLEFDDGVDQTNCSVMIVVEGGIELCSTNGEGCVVVGAPQVGAAEVKELTIEEVSKINAVKGVAGSEHFADCRIEATLKMPNGFKSIDAVRFTVVTVDVSIKGQDEIEEEKEGAYVLFVDDFSESPYAPRATNYFETVEMWICPKDFPEDLQTNIWIEITGDAKTHLYECKEMEATWGIAPYSLASNVYTMAELNEQDKRNEDEPPLFVLHGDDQSKTLRDKKIIITEPKTTVEDIGRFTVVKLNLVPDYDRNHKIDDDDEKTLCMDKTFYWWINDDHDKGDCASMYKDHGSEIHGAKAVEVSHYLSKKANMSDKEVNGRTDLLDFFPMWLDAYDMFELFKGKEEVSITMKFPGLGIVSTNLDKESAGNFLMVPCFTAGGGTELYEAEVDVSHMTDFSEGEMEKLLESVKESPESGIIMAEGAGGGSVTVVLSKKNRVTGENEEILSSVCEMSMLDVRAFYNEVSLYNGEAKLVRERDPALDELFSERKDVFSLHGFKVDSTHADGWHSEFFKRLYQSQSYAKFWGVTWDGAQSDGKKNPGRYYHQDAAHAFTSGKLLRGFVDDQRRKGKLKGEVSVMAHSLGNMVVSAAVAIEKMKIDRYLMLDAAVPVEAYDGEKDDDRMINPAWKEYPKNSFCSKWHELFEASHGVGEDGKLATDARKDLKWPELFKNMDCTIFNYYSAGDEVFELAEDIKMRSGFKLVMDGYYDVSRYSWQKQEVSKGVEGILNVLVDDNPSEGISEHSGGWGFHNTTVKAYFLWIIPYNKVVHVYDPVQAAAASPDALMHVPVFAHSPQYAFEWDKYDNKLTRQYKTGLLCHVVPAMSEAAGRCRIKNASANWNLNSGGFKQNWGRNDGTYTTRWLHCDLKDMAYLYNHKAWIRMVEDGNFKKEEGK